MEITGGMVDRDVVARMVSTFHPGFIGPRGTVNNTLALSHHGGSPMFQSARANMMAQIDTEFSAEGGSTGPAEVRQGLATPILFTNQVGNYKVTIRARLYQRNTTPLFGLGLVDKVRGRDLEEQFKLQKQHPEVSGRPSTLGDGRYGRFGWRGNIATLLEFCDQACAAEVGLETSRKRQPRDPMTPGYRNPTVDIKDGQIVAMRDFLAALPAPVRELPSDSDERAMAIRGEQLFASVGCAVCHVADMGPAKGLYSDLLLHDMGYELIDLNHAEPYIDRATPASRTTKDVNSITRQVDRNTTGYYGGSESMTQEIMPSGGVACWWKWWSWRPTWFDSSDALLSIRVSHSAKGTDQVCLAGFRKLGGRRSFGAGDRYQSSLPNGTNSDGHAARHRKAQGDHHPRRLRSFAYRADQLQPGMADTAAVGTA